MATLQISFTTPNTPPTNGYIVNYRKVGEIEYTTISPNPTSSPVTIAGIAPGNYEGNIQADCGGYFSEALPFLAIMECPEIEPNFDVRAGSTSSLANVMVTPSGGVAPYTYLWSTGDTGNFVEDLIKNETYNLTITDANGCSISTDITPNITVLRGLSIEVMYFDLPTSNKEDKYYPRNCSKGHICNRARFEVLANGISQGIANMNNSNGTSVENGTIDDVNRPPDFPNYDSPTAKDRYFIKVISGTEAAAIANTEGKVEITLSYTGIDNNPHSEAVWLRIKKEDGTVVSNSCVNAFTSFEFDPYI